MSERLDRLLERLAAAPTDRSLEHLPAQVDRDVAARIARARAGRALAPVRVASIGLALATGLTAGGLTAASSASTTQPAAALTAAIGLAPSTLLDGAR